MKDNKKSKRGRPLSYNKNIARKAYELAKFGCKDTEIASFLGINKSTLIRWKKEFPELCDFICRGRIDHVSYVKRSVFRRAIGYRYSEVTKQKIEVERVNNEGEIEKIPAILTKVVSKHMAPDVNACQLILKNSKAKEW